MAPNEESCLLQSNEVTKNTGLSSIYTIICIVDVFGVFPLVALPYAIIKCGFFGIPLIILVCGLQIYTAVLLARCWLIMEDVEPTIHAKRRYPYSALAEAAFGNNFARFVTLVVNFGIFSASIPNLIVASQNLQLLSENITDIRISYCSWIIIVGVAICPFLWFGSPKDIKHLSSLSGVIVLSVFGLILLNLLTVPQKSTNEDLFTSDSLFLWKKLLSAYGMLTFQFDIHPTILNIHLDMKNRKNIYKSLVGGFIVTLSLFGIIGAVASIILEENLQPSILESLTITNTLHLAAFLVAIQLVTSSAICNNSFYQQMEETLGISKDFTWRRCVIRTVLTFVTVVIAESVPRFDLVMTFIGGALTGPLAFILPPLFYVSIVRKLRYLKSTVLIMVDPFCNEIFEEKVVLNNDHHTYTYLEVYFCIIIIIVGFIMTILSTYHSFENNIRYSAFYPPCIYNFTS